MPGKFNHTIAFIIMSLILGIGKTDAQSSTYGKLQAVYMYNFAKYIKWPNDFEQFNIAVLGDAEIIEDLKTTLKDKKASGKEINVNVIGAAEQARNVNIVYIPASRSRDLPLLLKMLEDSNVLIVTEEDLARKGAGISFIIEDDKLGFKINKNVLLRAGLILSEGLLKMAIII